MERDLVSIDDFSNKEIMEIMRDAFEFKYSALNYKSAQDKVMLGLFFEPSTRTRLSFERAMQRLGGQATIVAERGSTSLAKGETLADTARVVAGYGYDLIVVRHPWEGTAQVLADYGWVPVINAGDGAHEHPSQTLVDLFTIRQHKGHLNRLRIGLCGDLMHGRTVHSLAIAMARFGAEKIVCLALPGLEMPEWVADRVERSQTKLIQEDISSLESVIEDLDALYWTRVQEERLADQEIMRQGYVLDDEVLQKAKEDLLILHPLPRTEELPREIDKDPRSKYFEQSDNGVPVRMALITALLGKLESKKQLKTIMRDERCLNRRCVTFHEQYLTPAFKRLPEGHLSCFYCGHLLKIY